MHAYLPCLCATQGAPESGWILLDYGDIIVHIMTPKSRSYYDLESFWSNGVEVPLEGVLKPNAPERQEVAVAEEVVSIVCTSPTHASVNSSLDGTGCMCVCFFSGRLMERHLLQ